MLASGQPLAAQHRLRGICAGADDVGAPHGLLERVEHIRPEVSGERLGLVAGAARDADLGKVARAGDRVYVRPTLNAGPEHSEHPCVLSCERAGSDGGRRSRPHGGDGSPVHDGER